MSEINLSLKHNRTLAEARGQMEKVVAEVIGRFGLMIGRVEWSQDRNAVTLGGTGFEVRMRVDAEHFHLTGDIPLLGGLLQGPLAQGLKKLIEKHFPPRLS